MIYLKMAKRNLMKYRKKSLAAFLSIIVAFMSLSLFSGYIHDVRKMYLTTFSERQMLGDVILERSDTPFPGKTGIDEFALNVSQQDWIDAYLAGHDTVNQVKFMNINGTISNGNVRSIFVGLAYDLAAGEKMRGQDYAWLTFAGRPLERAPQNHESMLLADKLSRDLDCTTAAVPSSESFKGDEKPFQCERPSIQLNGLTESGQSNAIDAEVSGIMTTGFGPLDKHFVMLPLTTAQLLYNTKNVSYMSVKLKDEPKAAAWISAFDQAADAAHQPIKASAWPNHPFGDLYRQSMDFLNVFRNLVVTIILLIVTMAVINTFVKMVQERLNEIGTLRSIGYQRNQVLAIFCWEALLLALVGSIAGCIASSVFAALCNGANIIYKAGFLSEGVLFRISLSPLDFVWIAGLISTLTLVSTVLAAWQACGQVIARLLVER